MTEELTVEGELTRNGVWDRDERELARGRKDEIELRRVEKGEGLRELKKRERKNEEKKKMSEEVESKKKWRKKMEPNVVGVFCFFFFFFVVFFLIVLKNNKLALRKLKTTIFFIKQFFNFEYLK